MVELIRFNTAFKIKPAMNGDVFDLKGAFISIVSDAFPFVASFDVLFSIVGINTFDENYLDYSLEDSLGNELLLVEGIKIAPLPFGKRTRNDFVWNCVVNVSNATFEKPGLYKHVITYNDEIIKEIPMFVSQVYRN